jgi:hypothetical protein
MTARIVIVRTDGTEVSETRLLSFSFHKEAYLPYTILRGRMKSDMTDVTGAAEIKFFIGQTMVHHGLADSLTAETSGGSCILTFASRSFTSLLCQNQIEPGMKTGVSINSLMDGYYTLPYVTHENDPDTSSYIYVKNNSTMWDGVANLAYKLHGTYPYIRGTNCVRITPVSQPAEFGYTSGELLSVGSGLVTSRMTSDFHMSDINGDFGNYDYTDTDAAARRIVRHRYFELDRQFLRDPQDALLYRDKFACRGWKRYFCSYCGYNGEDLSDVISFGSVTDGRICEVEITGSSAGIVTGISVYLDKFHHQ